jgi:hypothetical protein
MGLNEEQEEKGKMKGRLATPTNPVGWKQKQLSKN